MGKIGEYKLNLVSYILVKRMSFASIKALLGFTKEPFFGNLVV